ncbi:MAG TPA: ROK family transcriptional regulator [Candidatus Butyricicoccus avistercoris]|uniref:ROK family transcriptional regulator n=1 Tax=Candidatus Butyricicoccus avistercoris TaxID=2838518 RepID=A0A9D1TI26_9FIRM|nr:ROK family transcriptional regulator [Candidatus Butyricicoccus avistercoris]
MIRNKITNIEVKKNNRNQIFRYICKNKTVSNPDIAYNLQISLPTVTQNTRELLENGLIKEVGEFKSTGGRRAKALEVEKNAYYAVGLDITKNHVVLLLINILGEVIKFVRISYIYNHDDSYYSSLNEKLEDFISDIDKNKILGIGISFAGIVDLDKQKIMYSHILNVQSISFSYISKFFNYPCLFLNDANAGAFAECSNIDDTKRFFYLSLSNTVGGAIISNKNIVQGDKFRCGEVGHMTIVLDGDECYCGKKGCMDVYCSAKILSETPYGKIETFFDKLSEGEQNAKQIWDKYTDYLAVAINNLHMILDSDIILGGYVGNHIEPYINDIWQKIVNRNTFVDENIFIKSCKYKTETAALGAALKIMEDFIKKI